MKIYDFKVIERVQDKAYTHVKVIGLVKAEVKVKRLFRKETTEKVFMDNGINFRWASNGEFTPLHVIENLYKVWKMENNEF